MKIETTSTLKEITNKMPPRTSGENATARAGGVIFHEGKDIEGHRILVAPGTARTISEVIFHEIGHLFDFSNAYVPNWRERIGEIKQEMSSFWQMEEFLKISVDTDMESALEKLFVKNKNKIIDWDDLVEDDKEQFLFVLSAVIHAVREKLVDGEKLPDDVKKSIKIGFVSEEDMKKVTESTKTKGKEMIQAEEEDSEFYDTDSKKNIHQKAKEYRNTEFPAILFSVVCLHVLEKFLQGLFPFENISLDLGSLRGPQQRAQNVTARIFDKA